MSDPLLHHGRGENRIRFSKTENFILKLSINHSEDSVNRFESILMKPGVSLRPSPVDRRLPGKEDEKSL